MFFFLRNLRRADYLHHLMWFTFRFLVVVLLPLTVLTAQEHASPTPPPEASASPGPSPSIEPSPTPEPATEPPSPEASPTPSADVIPLEGQPSDAVIGAPLETRDLAPVIPRTDEAMPDDAFTSSNAVIPDTAPPALPVAAESAEEKARQISIHYRELRVKAEKDPAVLQMFQRADEARSEEDRRAALREYYRLLFKKIVTMDKALESHCGLLQDAYIRRLAQVRLEPTIPLNPPPTPEPIGN